jgi:hypothetical protein
VAIIYTNVFSISQVNDIADKIKVSETPQIESPNSLGQRNAGATKNLDGDVPTSGYRPYLTVVSTVEPLDKYDIQRLAANMTFYQSSGFDFANTVHERFTDLKGRSGTEYFIMTNVMGSYFRDSWYNGLIMNASLANFVRPGNTGPELVFNSANVQWMMSHQMQKSGYNIYVYHQNCYSTCGHVQRTTEVLTKMFTLLGAFAGYITEYVTNSVYECREICSREDTKFVRDWFHNPNAVRYNPGSSKITGTLNYTVPNTIPEFFTEPVAGTVKTYNFSFTPPAR